MHNWKLSECPFLSPSPPVVACRNTTTCIPCWSAGKQHFAYIPQCNPLTCVVCWGEGPERWGWGLCIWGGAGAAVAGVDAVEVARRCSPGMSRWQVAPELAIQGLLRCDGDSDLFADEAGLWSGLRLHVQELGQCWVVSNDVHQHGMAHLL